jgi:hypothetical protein
MERVTTENIDDYMKRYSVARGGELNEDTDSEAAFVVLAQYRGAYILNTGLGPLWIGVQNASARWTDDGKPFQSVLAALEAAMTSSHPTAMGAAVYYSEDSVERLRWLADQLEEFKKAGTFLLWA